METRTRTHWSAHCCGRLYEHGDPGEALFESDHAANRCPEEGWVHDPARDGAGCGWCGAYAQVDSDNLCADCF